MGVTINDIRWEKQKEREKETEIETESGRVSEWVKERERE